MFCACFAEEGMRAHAVAHSLVRHCGRVSVLGLTWEFYIYVLVGVGVLGCFLAVLEWVREFAMFSCGFSCFVCFFVCFWRCAHAFSFFLFNIFDLFSRCSTFLFVFLRKVLKYFLISGCNR